MYPILDAWMFEVRWIKPQMQRITLYFPGSVVLWIDFLTFANVALVGLETSRFFRLLHKHCNFSVRRDT